MRNFSEESFKENRNTHFTFNNFFQDLVIYEIRWKNIVQLGRPQMTVWPMRISYCVPKATNTHTQVA